MSKTKTFITLLVIATLLIGTYLVSQRIISNQQTSSTNAASSRVPSNATEAMDQLSRYCGKLPATDIDKKPYITSDQINTILAQYNSPMLKEKGFADYLETLGDFYSIDPLILLAFSKKESQLGKDTNAQMLHSVGYKLCSSDNCNGKVIGGRKFQSYAKWSDSAADWYSLMYTYKKNYGLTTIETVMMRYSPWFDNSTSSPYANTCQQIDQAVAFYNKWRNTKPSNVATTTNTNTANNQNQNQQPSSNNQNSNTANSSAARRTRINTSGLDIYDSDHICAYKDVDGKYWTMRAGSACIDKYTTPPEEGPIKYCVKKGVCDGIHQIGVYCGPDPNNNGYFKVDCTLLEKDYRGQ